MTASPVSPPAMTAWAGLCLVLGPLLVRASASSTTLPYWDIDPTLFPLVTPAIGPAGSMLVDVLVLIGAALLLMAERSARRRVHPLWVLALAVGGAWIMLHGWWWQAIGSAAPHGTLGNQRIGSAWLGAMAAAVAVLHAARDNVIRRTVAGVILGFIVLLSLRGVQQVYIEHPMTLRAFNANPERWLAGYGWAPDSPMAQTYIRRMKQPEATGWFALSNVYASFAGLGLAIAGAWLVPLLRSAGKPDPRMKLMAFVALVAAAVATFLADSKGGYAVAVLAAALLTLGHLASRRRVRDAGVTPRTSGLAWFLGPLCITGVLAAVALRGLIGERIGELSILFRWFYMQASFRIFSAHPVTGVGPDGFQLAYLTAKNPLNPEEVGSPHSIMLDWIATIGLAGLAWSALLVAMSAHLGRSLVCAAGPDAALGADAGVGDAGVNATRAGIRTGALVLAAATITVSWIETPHITPDSALVRMASLALGCLIVFAVLRSASVRAVAVGLAAGGLAVLAHAQIELTGSSVPACGLFLVTIAAGSASSLSHRQSPGRPLLPVVVAAALVGSAAIIALRGVLPAQKWQQTLARAAAAVQPIAEINELLIDAGTRPGDAAAAERISRRLTQALGHPVTMSAAGVSAAMVELDRKLLPVSARLMDEAQRLYPDDWRIGREAGRLYLRLITPIAGARAEPLPQPTVAGYREAALAAIPVCVPPADAARAARNPPRDRARALALEAAGDGAAAARLLAAAFADDPYNLDIALRLFKLARHMGLADDSRRWAAKCLELDASTRLDRGIRGLSPQDRREVEAAAAALPAGR